MAPLLVLLPGCPAGIDRPDRVVTPDVVGIIETADISEDGTTTRIEVEVGGIVVFNREIDTLLAESTSLTAGNLVLSGALDESLWFLALRRGATAGPPEDCFRIGTKPFDDGDSVIFPAGGPDDRFGVRLPKAQSFTAERPNPQTGRWGEFDGAFCLNEMGEVTGQADKLVEELRGESE